MKGKIFNAQEVQAIIAGNKTMFREVIMSQRATKESQRTPRFEVGKTIFVKESFWVNKKHGKFCWYDNDIFECGDAVVKKLAQHMKQEQSRIALRIKSVKVERLQDISGEDCKKEGIGYTGGWNGEDYDDGEYYFGELTESEEGIIEYTTEMFQFCDRFACKNEMFEYAEDAFEAYWNLNHKKQEHKWEANPWVFAYEFEIINFNK